MYVQFYLYNTFLEKKEKVLVKPNNEQKITENKSLYQQISIFDGGSSEGSCERYKSFVTFGFSVFSSQPAGCDPNDLLGM